MTSKSINVYDIDFSYIYEKANEILISSKTVKKFPFNIKRFIEEQSDIKLCTYKKALGKYGIDIKVFGSESAILQEYCGAAIIFYNDSEPECRVRFSLLHEYAHYYLGHKMNLRKEENKYQKQEVEANFFAAQILMPKQIIREALNRGYTTNEDFIMSAFGVSKDAAHHRKRSLEKYNYEWRKQSEKEFDDIIIKKFADVIDYIAPIRKQYTYFCLESELEIQEKRNSWMDPRSRWKKGDGCYDCKK